MHPTPHTPAPELQPENFENEGQWLIAVFDRHFSKIESNEIPIEPREHLPSSPGNISDPQHTRLFGLWN